MTLLYPFVAPERLDGRIRERLAEVARAHPAFDYALAGQARWPETRYVRVEPVAPFVDLQAALEAAFPDFPIYGGATGFDFVPHVTIAEGGCVEEGAVERDRAWAALPRARRAAAIELIARPDAGSWRRGWRMPLGPSRSVGRMRR